EREVVLLAAALVGVALDHHGRPVRLALDRLGVALQQRLRVVADLVAVEVEVDGLEPDRAPALASLVALRPAAFVELAPGHAALARRRVLVARRLAARRRERERHPREQEPAHPRTTLLHGVPPKEKKRIRPPGRPPRHPRNLEPSHRPVAGRT